MASIYLVLDMQNELVHQDGANGQSPLGQQVGSRGIIAKTQLAIEKARAAGIKVGFVRVGFSPEYQECPAQSPIFGGAKKAGAFKLGTWGTEIHPDLDVQPGDIQVVKHRVSPFYSTTLSAQLRAQGIDTIFCSGVSTQAVVQATIRDGHDRDYRMILLEDCCAAHSPEEHANSVESIGRFCEIATSDSVDFNG